ncbi:type II toxin-antitoxin system RelE/ParE family toxin [Magnetococcales bacterium HHB-1]
MKFIFSKRFLKALDKLSTQNQERVENALDLFLKNPFTPSLRNHALSGKLKGSRSLTAGYDLRIIFKEHDGYIVVTFLDVETHRQVYS